MTELGPHHRAWLDAHTDRAEGWLRDRLAEGFDVHHLDGDADNNAPANLVLIEHTDHMRLHGMSGPGRLRPVNGIGKCRRFIALPDGRTLYRHKREREASVLRAFAANPTGEAWRLRITARRGR